MLLASRALYSETATAGLTFCLKSQIYSNVRRLLVAPRPTGAWQFKCARDHFQWIVPYLLYLAKGQGARGQGAAHFGTLYEFPLSLSGGAEELRDEVQLKLALELSSGSSSSSIFSWALPFVYAATHLKHQCACRCCCTGNPLRQPIICKFNLQHTPTCDPKML